MKVIVGLGNPGKKFLFTRHNVGFIVLDQFAKKNRFPRFRLVKNFFALLSEALFGGKKIVLLKPQTFMNNSGKAVKKAMDNLQFTIDNLYLVHDDLDIPLGKMKISLGRSSAGHKGVQSVIDHLKTRGFVRFRIGISPSSGKKITNGNNFVLEKFTNEERIILKKVIKKAVNALEKTIKEGIDKAMSEFNQ